MYYEFQGVLATSPSTLLLRTWEPYKKHTYLRFQYSSPVPLLHLPFHHLTINPGGVSSLLQLLVHLQAGHNDVSSPVFHVRRRSLPKLCNLACMTLFTPSYWTSSSCIGSLGTLTAYSLMAPTLYLLYHQLPSSTLNMNVTPKALLLWR